MAVPIHNAGGETTVHAAFRAMVNRDHEVRVLCRPHTEERKFQDYEYEGVKVYRCADRDEQNWVRDFAKDYAPDILITHLDLTPQAMQLSLDIKRPLAHFIHNSMQLKYHGVTPFKCQLAIFNSNWVAEAEEWKGPQIVIHPVVEPDRYRCEKGTNITLVNPTPGKGADIFYALTKALPHRQFLVVKSVYGEQIAPPAINAANFPNVETMEHTADIREVFQKTKVLLMPSNYESYGRVAVEAACCAIPTIANPTPGLKESLGRAGIFHNRVEWGAAEVERARFEACIQEWASEIERLMTDEVYYRKQSDLALELANSLDPDGEYDRLEDALLVTVSHWNNKQDENNMLMWTTDREIYKDAEGNLTIDRDKAISLYRGKHQRMPLDEAIALGLASVPAHRVERDLDTWDLTHPKDEAKAADAPEETKAFDAPAEKKGRKKKTA